VALEGQIDAGDEIEVVEDDQGGGVVEQSDTAGFEAAVFLAAREEAVELLFVDQL
jgi:hypothetical protein